MCLLPAKQRLENGANFKFVAWSRTPLTRKRKEACRQERPGRAGRAPTPSGCGAHSVHGPRTSRPRVSSEPPDHTVARGTGIGRPRSPTRQPGRAAVQPKLRPDSGTDSPPKRGNVTRFEAGAQAPCRDGEGGQAVVAGKETRVRAWLREAGQQLPAGATLWFRSGLRSSAETRLGNETPRPRHARVCVWLRGHPDTGRPRRGPGPLADVSTAKAPPRSRLHPASRARGHSPLQADARAPRLCARPVPSVTGRSCHSNLHGPASQTRHRRCSVREPGPRRARPAPLAPRRTASRRATGRVGALNGFSIGGHSCSRRSGCSGCVDSRGATAEVTPHAPRPPSLPPGAPRNRPVTRLCPRRRGRGVPPGRAVAHPRL